MSGGHVAVNCIGQQRLDSGEDAVNQLPKLSIKGEAPLEQPKWFSKVPSVPFGPSASNPPAFSSFTAWWGAGLTLQLTPQVLEARVIPWTIPLKPMEDGPNTIETHSSEEGNVNNNTQVQKVQGAPSSFIQSISLRGTRAGGDIGENPHCHHNSLECIPQALSSTMAFQQADPRPFLPDNVEVLQVPNRVFMVRAVAHSRPPPRHENVAIATIAPLPGNAMNFNVVREVLREFFQRERVSIRDI